MRFAADDGDVAEERPRSLADLARMRLREAILRRELRPGEALPLKEQAQRLGMSIMPVREAIQRLAYEGLVVHEPQRGAVVAPLSEAALRDLYGVRIALEGLAVREAAGRIRQADYERLTELLGRLEETYRRGDEILGRRLHRSFHLGLYRQAGSAWLERLIPPLLDNSERYRTLSIPYRGSPEERRREHQEILDACRAGDGAEAERLLRRHLERTVELVTQEIAREAGPSSLGAAEG